MSQQPELSRAARAHREAYRVIQVDMALPHNIEANLLAMIDWILLGHEHPICELTADEVKKIKYAATCGLNKGYGLAHANEIDHEVYKRRDSI